MALSDDTDTVRFADQTPSRNSAFLRRETQIEMNTESPTATTVCFRCLDFISVDAVVEFDYGAGEDDELSLAVGEIISNITKQDGGWWEGEVNGKRGMFPDNFVKVLHYVKLFFMT